MSQAPISHVLILSVGPVQEFIAAARRFRDLWFGSWMLGEVAKAAARAIAEAEPKRLEALVFPAPATMDELAPGGSLGLANKVLAIIEGDPRTVAEAAIQAARVALLGLAEEAFNKEIHGPGFDRIAALAQVADLLECQWAAVPIVAGDYKVARDAAERLLAARKNTRDFGPVGAWADARPKSSLDGLREAVVDPAAIAEAGDSDRLHKLYGLRKGENLCGVGFLKRLGGMEQAERVPSTSHMAALASVARHDPALLQPHADALLEALGALGADKRQIRRRDVHPALGRLAGHALYEERLTEVVPETRRAEAIAALRTFLRDTKVKPQPYYVVLIADGDRMGKAIDGALDAATHREITRKLAHFAKGTGGIVETHEGSLIYAGGDDVLALLPLHRALDCAEQLAKSFAACLAGVDAGDGLSPTLSVGLAVGHQLDPADETLAAARKGEKEAKRTRAALGIIVNKRGGSELVVADTWESGIVERLKTWIDLLANGGLPDGAGYELRTLGRTLTHIPEAARLEASRVLRRKRNASGDKLTKDTLDLLFKPLDAKGGSVGRLADELTAARTFATVAPRG